LDYFSYRDGELHAEDVAVSEIVRACGTPVYVYSSATLLRHWRVFADAMAGLDPLICYAVKANGNRSVVTTLARLGAGADVVSGGELATALDAGIDPGRIVFSGVGKTDFEIRAALSAGILQFNVESVPEMEALSCIAEAQGTTARVALRINPDVDPRTHVKIATGLQETKFGIEWTAAREVYQRAASLPGLHPVGIAVHIGSQITDVEPFEQAFRRVRDLVAMLRADGHSIATLDLGGGIGVPYKLDQGPQPGPEAYAAVVRRTVGDLGSRLIFEPGRVLVANAGILVCRVLYVKSGAMRTFVIVDAGMTDLLRPSLYDAWHEIVPVADLGRNTESEVVDVVGPVCETADTIGHARALPPLARGDLLAVRTAGAYGAAMASFYNGRSLPAEVLVEGARFALVRPSIPWQTLAARERLPKWLEGESVPAPDPVQVRSAR
jgi:diaminopimelate decarboxylase